MPAKLGNFLIYNTILDVLMQTRDQPFCTFDSLRARRIIIIRRGMHICERGTQAKAKIKINLENTCHETKCTFGLGRDIDDMKELRWKRLQLKKLKVEEICNSFEQ